MVSDPAADTPAADEDEDGDLLIVQVAPEAAGGRLDKTLAALVPDLSRARIQALLAEGAVSREGAPVRDGSAKALAGAYEILVPAVISAEPAAQDLPLTVLFEDSHLIIIDKAAGMAVHPAPGTPDGTVVNALLHHCGASLSGIGGVARPGIVHRLDKDTSGVMVCAKTDAAHQGLSALFAAHDIDRAYVALTRGAPKPRKGTIESRLGRSAHDRKKMAVLRTGGREAITHYEVTALFGPSDRPTAARVRCRLETGRTHQIRVHMA
ncbi:RluA family pseudouridine synthase, partial [Phenylobacterium sp.]